MANQAALPFLQQSASLPPLPASILPSPGRALYECEISRNTPLGLSKAPHGGGFVFEYLEHRVEFGDLQQILDTLAQAKQFKLAAMIGYGGEAGNHFADSRAVDIRNVAQVYQQLLLAFGSQIADRIPKSACALAEGDTACGIDYSYVAYLAGRQFNAHEFETSPV